MRRRDTDRDRDRETETERERERDPERQRQRERKRLRETHTHIRTETETEGETGKQRQRERETETETERGGERETVCLIIGLITVRSTGRHITNYVGALCKYVCMYMYVSVSVTIRPSLCTCSGVVVSLQVRIMGKVQRIIPHFFLKWKSARAHQFQPFRPRISQQWHSQLK